MIRLPGSRVVLRDWQLGDLPDFTRWQKPGQLWQELDDPVSQSFTDTSAAATASLEAEIRAGLFPRPRTRLVIAARADDGLLGTVSCYWESQETNWLCCGVTLYDPATWRCGYGREALQIWIDYIFEAHPEITRLDLRTWSGNHGMIRLAEKLGFTREACFRRARVVKSEYFDVLGYGILREEWGANLRPRG